MDGTCPRCGGATDESRWCPACGKKLIEGFTLPTPEAAEAARRETAWFEAQRKAGASGPPEAAAAPGAPPPGYPPQPAEGPPAYHGPPAYQGPPAHPAPPTYPPPQAYMPADPPADPSGRAQVLRWFLYAHIVVAAVVGILATVFHRAVGNLTGEGVGSTGQREETLAAVSIAYSGQLLLLCVTLGFFIAWLHRVYKNVRGLGADELRYDGGWAIGGWFVPILAWWRPKEIVNDTWRASDPALGVHARRYDWEGAPVPGVFLAWWLAYNFWGSRTGSRSGSGSPPPSTRRSRWPRSSRSAPRRC